MTTLHDAAADGSLLHPEDLDEYRQAAGGSLDLSAVDAEGRTALSYAASAGHVGVVKLLVDQGADVNKLSKDNRSALWWAAASNMHRQDRLDIIAHLVDKGAAVDAQAADGYTPLMKVVEDHRDTDLISYLVDHGASTKLRRSAPDGPTAEDLASATADPRVVWALKPKSQRIAPRAELINRILSYILLVVATVNEFFTDIIPAKVKKLLGVKQPEPVTPKSVDDDEDEEDDIVEKELDDTEEELDDLDEKKVIAAEQEQEDDDDEIVQQVEEEDKVLGEEKDQDQDQEVEKEAEQVKEEIADQGQVLLQEQQAEPEPEQVQEAEPEQQAQERAEEQAGEVQVQEPQHEQELVPVLVQEQETQPQQQAEPEQKQLEEPEQIQGAELEKQVEPEQQAESEQQAQERKAEESEAEKESEPELVETSQEESVEMTPEESVEDDSDAVLVDAANVQEPLQTEPVIEINMMSALFAKVGVSEFFGDNDEFLQKVADKAAALKDDASNLLKTDDDISNLATLALYQPVTFCDDSLSMWDGTRIQDQTELVERISRISTRLAPQGYGCGLQFLNFEHDFDEKLHADEVAEIVSKVKPNGSTQIGTNLKKKVLEPLVYDVLNEAEGRLARPILIVCIIDGHPTGEEEEALQGAILECAEFLEQKGYRRTAVLFQIGQIGNDEEAAAFLRRLGNDARLKEVVECWTERLDEEWKRLQGSEEAVERWLLNSLLRPVMREQL